MTIGAKHVNAISVEAKVAFNIYKALLIRTLIFLVTHFFFLLVVVEKFV